MSVAHRATPTASADSRVEISARAATALRLLNTRSSATSTALARTWAMGRSGSTLVDRLDLELIGAQYHPLFAAVD